MRIAASAIDDYPTEDTGWVICRHWLSLSRAAVSEQLRQRAVEVRAHAERIEAFAVDLPELPAAERFEQFLFSLDNA